MNVRIGQMTLPVEYRHDIEKAIGILKSEGDVEIYLFGSLAVGNAHQRSDIDIAVRGLAPARYFEVFGRLLVSLDHPVDLVDLDSDNPFVRMLLEKGSLNRVA